MLFTIIEIFILFLIFDFTIYKSQKIKIILGYIEKIYNAIK